MFGQDGEAVADKIAEIVQHVWKQRNGKSGWWILEGDAKFMRHPITKEVRPSEPRAQFVSCEPGVCCVVHIELYVDWLMCQLIC